MTQTYSIQANDGITRMIFAPEKGGVGISLIMPDDTLPEGKRELLYLPEGVSADNYDRICGGWPFCFPVCARVSRAGKSQYLYDGQVYDMGIHGFAQYEPWTVLEHKHDEITLQLTDNDRTRAVYPFAFDVRLTYRVSPGELVCEQVYYNPGDGPLLYAAGFHPYFSIPFDRYRKDDVQFVYYPEVGLQYNEALDDIVGHRFSIDTPIALTVQGFNEQLAKVGKNKTTSLYFPDGRRLEMTAGPHKSDLFSFVHIYHQVNEPFFCIEPWTSHPNAINTMGAMRTLQPGMQDEGRLVLQYH